MLLLVKGNKGRVLVNLVWELKMRRYTWKAPGKDGQRYQLDYIMVRQRYKNSVKNAHTYPGADADTDHNLLVMKMKMKLKFVRRKRKTKDKWNLAGLAQQAHIYQQNVESELSHEVNSTTKPDERWKQLKKAIQQGAASSIGYRKTSSAKKPWVTEEMIQRMDERRKWKHQSTEAAKQEYRRLNNQLRRDTDKAKEKWWADQCDELEELQASGRHDLVYDKIKKLSGKRMNRATCIKNKHGEMLHEPEEVRKRWRSYIEELYAANEKPDSLNEQEIDTNMDDMGPELLKSEIEAAIAELKKNKAEGIDDIPAELLKHLGTNGKKELVKLCQDIYISGEWPTDFLQTVMIPLEKKPHATECGDFRTISLISHAAKIILRILTKRLEAKVDAINGISEAQFGFRRGKGTRDAIGVLRTIAERSLEVQQDVYICFVDYEKAFDRVNWKKLMNILRRIGVDYRDRRLIGNLYMGQTVMIRIEGENSEPGVLGRGVRQGCPLSPLLFNIYAEELIREALSKSSEGIKVGGKLINALRFADDQAIIAGTNEGLQMLMDLLNEASEEYGMKINLKKTKVMQISRHPVNITVVIEGNTLEQVQEFCYLGSLITEDGKCHKEIRRRIAMGKEAYTKRRPLIGKLNKTLQKRLVKTLIWPVTLYGSETWTLRKTDLQRLEAFEMWIWRRMEKISWTEKKSNEEVLTLVDENRNLIDTIRRRQRNWIGHILRSDCLLREILEGKIQGKKARGRPRLMMLDWMHVEEDRKKKMNRYNDLKTRAQDRKRWRYWSCEPANRQTT
jgi:hypothetical protein